ncbi:MAG: hypothetical protein CM1200mP22_10990 [Dehalococcoidia bacterium]|nr:MAG: hypothetical protein CM1200mP22_10990 [Dehalococcoidia bacterium]
MSTHVTPTRCFGRLSPSHGLGKVIRVVVFAGVEGAEEARAAGADFVGEDDLIEKIEAGWDDFEVGLLLLKSCPR